MSREVGLSSSDYTGSNPLYFVAYLVSNDQYVIGTTLEAYNASHYASYAIALQRDTTTGDYFADFPAVSDGVYLVKIKEQAGGSPSTGDNEIASSEIDWSSTPAADVTAAEMVALIKSALKKAPGATVSVTVDGQAVTYSRKDAIEELKYWQKEAALEAGTRTRVARIRLDRW